MKTTEAEFTGAPELPAHDATPGHGTRRSYLMGFALSAVLTAIPFWLVMTGALSPGQTAVAVIAAAVAQVLVHTVCFLHVNTRAEDGWSLVAYVFTGVILIITVAGSLWIMYHLNSNMMPGMMADQQSIAETGMAPPATPAEGMAGTGPQTGAMGGHIAHGGGHGEHGMQAGAAR